MQRKKQKGSPTTVKRLLKMSRAIFQQDGAPAQCYQNPAVLPTPSFRLLEERCMVRQQPRPGLDLSFAGSCGEAENITVCGVAPVPASTHRVS